MMKYYFKWNIKSGQQNLSVEVNSTSICPNAKMAFCLHALNNRKKNVTAKWRQTLKLFFSCGFLLEYWLHKFCSTVQEPKTYQLNSNWYCDICSTMQRRSRGSILEFTSSQRFLVWVRWLAECLWTGWNW